jgi:DNA-binding GntR family transcriptional regulator
MNARFRRAKEPLEAVHLDDEWHLALVAGCKNPVLLGLIEQMMWRTRRYELGLMKSRRGVARATGAHENIMEHLEAGDLAGACAALEENMRSGRQPILDWLAARGTG